MERRRFVQIIVGGSAALWLPFPKWETKPQLVLVNDRFEPMPERVPFQDGTFTARFDFDRTETVVGVAIIVLGEELTDANVQEFPDGPRTLDNGDMLDVTYSFNDS